jgi:allophanate hydrolase
MRTEFRLDLASLRELYKSGKATPSDVVAGIYDRIGDGPIEPVWVSMLPREKALAKARKLERDPLASAQPLYGVPFAVNDNIDLAGLPTTGACPAYGYIPGHSARVVHALIEAGAIPIGKTNLDQFAAGLAGTRSPYGACSSVFDPRYIAGGPSSGAAVAVASGFASFSLGTDTTGAGIAAAFNGLVGLKPTRGLLSTHGVIPGCRTLDCVSIFAANADDAHTVWLAARGFDPDDPFSRAPRAGEDAAPWLAGAFQFGVPPADQLEFFGDAAGAGLFEDAVARLEALGGRKVEIDFTLFRSAAELLHAGPWTAERYAALRTFLSEHAAAMNAAVRAIIEGARHYGAADAFDAEYRLRELRRATASEWEQMDVLLLPTAPAIYTHDEAAAEPSRIDANLGYYTSFLNLLDLAAVALPAGFRPNGLPFGVSLIGRAHSDEALLALAERYESGAAPKGAEFCPPGCIPIAVVGAHLDGQPLNWQLTDRGARRAKACRTAPDYRLFMLDSTMPPKPILVRDRSFRGSGIEVEVWVVPEDLVGGFVADIPAPFGIGNVVLEDGQTVKCFNCESHAVAGATDVSRFGGWRHYLAQAVSVK